MRNETRGSIGNAERRQDHAGSGNASGVGELRAVADRILETGARYLEKGRDFLSTRSEDMRERDWNDDEWGRGGTRPVREDDRRQGARGTYGADPGEWLGGRQHAYDEHPGKWSRPSPRRARHEDAGRYPPDEYAFSETGWAGTGRGGYDHDDRRAREYDERAAEMQRHRERSFHGSERHGFERGSGHAEPGRDYGAQGYRSQRGRGPRGYTRSDDRIIEDVSDRLSDDPLVDASGIDVRCEKGRITLEGEVPSRWMKHRAEDIVDSVSGVGDIDNRIRVARGDLSRGGTGNAGQDTPPKTQGQQPH